MAWVYIVRCADGTLYTGATRREPAHRVRVHNLGQGAKYCRARLPVRLVWCESHETWRAALKREYAIKQMGRAGKLALIEGCHDG